MGRTHVTQAVAVWATSCVAAAVTHHPAPLPVVLAGAATIAGAALLPDCDHREATLARLAGPVTAYACGGVADLSIWAHRATRTRYDRPTSDGHRGLTHTILAALTAGAAATLIGWLIPYGSAALITILAAAAVQAMAPARVRRWRRHRYAWAAGILAGIAAALTHVGGWWLGPIVTAGWLTHLAGDACSVQGVPLWWPARIRGQRWRMVGLWQPLRIHTGSPIEHIHAVAPVAVAAVSVAWALWR